MPPSIEVGLPLGWSWCCPACRHPLDAATTTGGEDPRGCSNCGWTLTFEGALPDLRPPDRQADLDRGAPRGVSANTSRFASRPQMAAPEFAAPAADTVPNEAQAELRSANAQVEYLLRDALARRGALPGRPPATAVHPTEEQEP